MIYDDPITLRLHSDLPRRIDDHPLNVGGYEPIGAPLTEENWARHEYPFIVNLRAIEWRCTDWKYPRHGSATIQWVSASCCGAILQVFRPTGGVGWFPIDHQIKTFSFPKCHLKLANHEAWHVLGDVPAREAAAGNPYR